MKRLLIVILLGAGAWFSYWGIGHFNTNAAYETWFEDRRNSGWLAEYGSLKTRGFPNRLDTTFEGISLADQNSGLFWSTDKFKLFTLVYQPNHVIALWPNQQIVETPHQKSLISAEDLRASIVLDKTQQRAIKRANLVGKGLTIASESTTDLLLSDLRVAVRQVDDVPDTLVVAVQADGVTRRYSDNPQRVAPTIDTLLLELSIKFDQTWDRRALEQQRPQPVKISIRNAMANWGKFEIKLAGELEIDAQGYPTGNLTVRAQNWMEMLAIARKNNRHDQLTLDLLEQGLNLVSHLSDNTQAFDIPLRLADKKMFLGPVPIGTAPKLRLR
ncbi:DUF2125 domain-containing protein [Cognatishimia sp. WU-CL00825]